MENDRKFMSAKPEPLKNQLNSSFVSKVGKAIKVASKNEGVNFDSIAFQKNCIDKTWNEKELKARIRHISKTIHKHLACNYKKQILILQKVASEFRGLSGLVFPDFVEVFGTDDVSTSLSALETLTQFTTGEFAIRPLIFKDEKKVMSQVKKWAKHPNEHVRRLASEGIRPRLPWATALPQFKKNPTSVLEVLELLKNDKSEYVRRSVANNLNDIAKDHPDLLLKTAKKWIGKTDATDKLLKHACRTLLKQGNSQALGIFGFLKNSNTLIQKFKIQNSKINIGDTLSFSFALINESKKEQQLRIEYIVYFLKKNGTHSAKVFQLSSKNFESGITSFKRSHRFKDFTTRKHHPGKHFIAIAVNGVEKGKLEIHLSR